MTRTVPGSGAKIEPLFNSIFGVRDVYVVDGGSGYNGSDPPKLTIANCGTPIREAVLSPVIENGQIASVNVLDPGEGYDPFRIDIDTEGNGTGAVAKAILWEEDQYDSLGNLLAPAGSIQYIQVLSNGDEYYSDVTSAQVKGGGGSGAELRPVVGLVTGLSLEQAGSNYEIGDVNLIVSGGGGQGATGVTEVSEFGIVKNINISNQGEFYETPPVILLNGGGGSGGKAKATVNLGAITNIEITNPGGGYSSNPQVIFTRNTNLTKESRTRQSFNSTIYDISGLLKDVDENDETIFVQTTAPYPGSGKILVGREVIRYTGKTLTSFTGCDRALNFRYDQKIILDSLSDLGGISQYNFNVGDRVVRTNESSGNKIARVYDWVPSERALYLVFEVDELAFIDGGSSKIISQVIDFTGGVAAASATGVEPHVLVDAPGEEIITLTVPIQNIPDKAFEDVAELDGAGDGIPDLVNTNTDFEGEISLDGGIASSLYGIEETLGGTNTTLFAVGDQMTDGSKPALSPTVSLAGELGDGDYHFAYVDFEFRSLDESGAQNFSVDETVTGSITGITATVLTWDATTKILRVKSVVENNGNSLWNGNELITGSSTGAVGTIKQILYPSSIRNEPD